MKPHQKIVSIEFHNPENRLRRGSIINRQVLCKQIVKKTFRGHMVNSVKLKMETEANNNSLYIHKNYNNLKYL